MKRSASDSTVASSVSGNGSTEGGLKRQRSQPQVADPTWPLDKQHADSIINFLIRLACQVMATGGQSELLNVLLFSQMILKSLVFLVHLLHLVKHCLKDVSL